MSSFEETEKMLETEKHFGLLVKGQRFSLFVPFNGYELTDEYKEKWGTYDPYIIVVNITGNWGILPGYQRVRWMLDGKEVEYGHLNRFPSDHKVWKRVRRVDSFMENMYNYPSGLDAFVDKYGHNLCMDDPNYWMQRSITMNFENEVARVFGLWIEELEFEEEHFQVLIVKAVLNAFLKWYDNE